MPASAPTPGGPGTTSDNEAVEAAQRVLTVTLQGRTLSFCPDNIPFQCRARFRKGTGGLPFEKYWDSEMSFGVDTLQAMWWMACMVNGELGLTIGQVEAEWPNPLEDNDWDARITGPGIPDDDEDDDNPEADDPESSGPAS